MSISIKSNVSSLTAQRSLTNTQNSLNKNFERLSTGLRINRAGDDAAGLGISENLKSQIRGLNQAKRNANDAISLIQTAEGSLSEISNILIRMRELAIQASTDTLKNEERTFLNMEYSQLQEEINRISGATEFNGIRLINGAQSVTGLSFQVGLEDNSSDRITITIASMDTASLGSAGSTSTLDSSDILAKTSARSAMNVIDLSIQKISSGRADLGAVQNRLNSTIINLSSARENLMAANSRIRDVDVAEETAEMTRNKILVQSGISVLSQANSSPEIALQLLR